MAVMRLMSVVDLRGNLRAKSEVKNEFNSRASGSSDS